MISHGRKRQHGMSMVELLVAMVIGMIVIGGAISLFVASKRSYTENERSERMIENARFALQMLQMEVRHAGFFGESAPPGISVKSGLSSVTGDCDDAGAAYKVSNSEYMFAVRVDASGAALGCINDAVPDTDVLVIKSVRPQPLSPAEAAADKNKAYVAANPISGLLFDNSNWATNAEFDEYVPSVPSGDPEIGHVWEYSFHVYYVRDGAVPHLARKTLKWAGTKMQLETEEIVEGVESLRVRLGVDGDSNGEVDSYLKSDEIASSDWDRVMSVELQMLVRSAEPDPAYVDQRKYEIGGETVTPGGNFHRTVIGSVISVRNPKLLIRGNI